MTTTLSYSQPLGLVKISLKKEKLFVLIMPFDNHLKYSQLLISVQ